MRKQIVKAAYVNKEIELDVLGFFLMEQCSNESINKAIENKWIDIDFANKLFSIK